LPPRSSAHRRIWSRSVSAWADAEVLAIAFSPKSRNSVSLRCPMYEERFVVRMARAAMASSAESQST
jgi:hypothetical protein